MAHDEATLDADVATHLKAVHKLQRNVIRVMEETSPDDRIDSAVLDNKRKRRKRKRMDKPESQRSGRYINYE